MQIPFKRCIECVQEHLDIEPELDDAISEEREPSGASGSQVRAFQLTAVFTLPIRTDDFC